MSHGTTILPLSTDRGMAFSLSSDWLLNDHDIFNNGRQYNTVFIYKEMLQIILIISD